MFSSQVKRAGFSFIELIVVTGVIGILVGIASVSLLRVQRKPALTSSVDTLIADIRQQQGKAMAGFSASSFGLYIGQHQYVLFKGTVYNASDPANATVATDPNIFLSTTFPNTAIVFASGSGEIISFSQAANTVTVLASLNQEIKTVMLNRYGVVTNVQ